MSKKFFLPDLGEGLPDATIVEWHVNVGDVIRLDENLVSMETAKAVVDVPSPVSGKVLKLAGAAGDVIVTGHWLAEFELDMSMPQRAEGQDTGHHHGGAPHAEPEPAAPAPTAKAEPADAGTVVGAMQVGNAVVAEAALAVGGVKAVPAVRATARKLGVDLARVRATGPDGTVTMQDVKQAAADASLLLPSPSGRAGGESTQQTTLASQAAPSSALRAPSPEGRRDEQQRSTLSQSGKPMRTQPPGVAASGQPEQLKGVRRNMARVMADAHAQVVPTTLVDDADLHAWLGTQDITAGGYRHRGGHRRWPVCARIAQRRHARRHQRARGHQAPAHAGGSPHDSGVGALWLHHFAVQLRHVRRPLCNTSGGAAVRGHRRCRQAVP